LREGKRGKLDERNEKVGKFVQAVGPSGSGLWSHKKKKISHKTVEGERNLHPQTKREWDQQKHFGCGRWERGGKRGGGSRRKWGRAFWVWWTQSISTVVSSLERLGEPGG